MYHEQEMQDSRILQSNSRNDTIKYGNTVKKTSNQVGHIQREFDYMNQFSEWWNGWHLPKRSFDELTQTMCLEYYSGEAKEFLQTHHRDLMVCRDFFDQILRMDEELRQKNTTLVDHNLKKETLYRYLKYSTKIGIEVFRGKINQILEQKNTANMSIKSYIVAMWLARRMLNSFEKKDWQQSYGIHWCLHLEHIRIDEDGNLVPIDFEHGARYPHRLKYQDEAYQFQNILQYFPNIWWKKIIQQWETHYDAITNADINNGWHIHIADVFLWILYQKAKNTSPNFDLNEIMIAVVEKLLWWLWEMYNNNDEGKFDDAIKVHVSYLLKFAKWSHALFSDASNVQYEW